MVWYGKPFSASLVHDLASSDVRAVRAQNSGHQISSAVRGGASIFEARTRGAWRFLDAIASHALVMSVIHRFIIFHEARRL